MRKDRLFALLFLVLSSVVLLPLLSGCGAGTEKERGLDSVLLVTLDTLRADYVSCYGSERVKTPHIDALATRGARMARSWTVVPLTTPAHASILTGLYPPGHGVRNNGRFRLPDSVTTLAEIMKADGKRTGAFVSAFTTTRLFGLAQGFDTYDDDFGHADNGKARSSRPGGEVAVLAESWLRQNASKPFFAWVHFFDPHTPYAAPPEFASQYRGNPYAGEVAYTDSLVGSLVATLESAGVRENTVVVVIADHGEGLRTHGEAEHGLLLYEESLSIPFVIVAPGALAPGMQVDQLASVVDVVPTVCGLLGLSTPEQAQGRDLFDVKAPEEEVSVYAETLYPHEEFGWSALYALRVGDRKVIAGPVPELFDLGVDAGERNSLAESNPGELSDLSAQLLEKATSILRPDNLSAAAGFSLAGDEDAIERLESLGYLSGGGASSEEEEVGIALPAIGGRNPRDAVEDVFALHRAQELLVAGDAASSVRMLKRVLKRDPDNPQVQLKLGLSQQVSGDEDLAEKTYSALLRAHPTFFLGYSRYSNLLVKQERYEEARLLWIRLEGQMPGYVAIPLRLAAVEILGGHAAQAASRLNELLDKRPGDAAAWGQLGLAQEALGEKNAAVEAFRRGLQVSATEKTCVEGSLRALQEGGREREAARLLDDLLVRAPGDPFLLKLRQSLQSQ